MQLQLQLQLQVQVQMQMQNVGWTGFPSTRSTSPCVTADRAWVERVDGAAVHPASFKGR